MARTRYSRWLRKIGVLAAAAGYFLTAVPAVSAAPTTTTWQANEDDALLFDMRVKNWRLGNGVRGYQTNSGICVDLADVVMAMDLPIRVDPKSRRATGWIFSEKRNFTLDYDSRTVQVGGKVNALTADDLRITPEGWCVSVKSLSEWLGVTLRVDMGNAFLIVESETKLPFEQAAERQSKAAQVRPKQTFDLADLPAANEPYKMFRAPSVDVTMGTAFIRESDGSRQTQVQFEVLASGEIATASFDARFASDTEGKPQSLRMRAYRTDPDGGLLGPLNATHFELGDIEMPGTPLVAQGSQGRGAFVTNRPIGRGDLFDTTDFFGTLPLGWDVELYRNGELLAFAVDKGTGLYEFRDIPMLFGQNSFEVKLHGPQGQEKIERRVIAVGLDSIPPRQTWYWAGVAQSGTDLIEFGDEPLRAQKGWRGGFGIERGLDSRTAIGANYYFLTQLADRRHYGELSVRRSIGPMLAEGGIATDFRGGFAWRGQIIGQLGNNNLRAESFWARGGYQSDRYGRTLRDEHRFSIDRNVTLGGSDIPIHLEVAALRYVGGTTNVRIDGRTNFSVGKLSLTTNIGWQKTVSGGFVGFSREELDGTLRLSGRWGKVRLRGETNIRFAPALELRESSLIAEWQANERESFRLQAGYDARADRGRLGVSYIRQFNSFALSGTAELASDGAFALGVTMNVSFGPKAQGGYQISSNRLAAQGRAEAIAYYDENGDGHRQSDEPIEKQVMIVAGTAQFAETDESGHAIVGGLAPFRPILIGIDASTLPDPFVQPAGPGMVVTPRPGVATIVELPLVAAGEIDGTLMGDGGRPLAGVKLELLNPKGSVVALTSSEFDGFFLFEKVPYGRYSLRIDAQSAAVLDLDTAVNANATLERGTPTVSLGIVGAKRQERESVANFGPSGP